MLERKEVPSLDSWFPVLNWTRMPNFACCHTNTDPNTFMTDYYVSEAISKLYRNIRATLSNGVNAANIRITGDPGSGKTSFLYALKRMAETSGNILEDFHLHIYHVNRAQDSERVELYQKEILHQVKRAWNDFYLVCGQSDHFDSICGLGLSNKETLQRLSQYYRENKTSFPKVMVFVVDDADALPGDHVLDVANIVLSSLELASVKKWIVLRDLTYDNYCLQTKAKIEQSFPDAYKFPAMSLYELARHRIEAIGEELDGARNPFSKGLCDRSVAPLCDYNMREGLSLLKSILEDNPPEGIDGKEREETVQKHIEDVSIGSFLQSHKLIDLHADLFRINWFPLAIDIVCCAVYQQNAELLYGAINDCATLREMDNIDLDIDKGTVLLVPQSDFNYVVRRLADHQLVNEITSGSSRLIKLSQKGRIMSEYIGTDAYFSYCKKHDRYAEQSARRYWLQAEKYLDHSQIVTKILKWKSVWALSS